MIDVFVFVFWNSDDDDDDDDENRFSSGFGNVIGGAMYVFVVVVYKKIKVNRAPKYYYDDSSYNTIDILDMSLPFFCSDIVSD